MPILGEPMIVRQIERVQRARGLTGLVVATSDDRSDDPLAEVCRSRGVAVFRGSLNDVLDRFYQAAKASSPDHLVRLTGDCPLIDPAVIDEVVGMHLSGGFDYTSNALEPTYPDGLDCEAMTFSALETAWKEARLSSEREHVTPYLYKTPRRFKVGVVKGARDLSNYRWTVDESADFTVIKAVYEALWPSKPAFDTADVLTLMSAHPELATANTHHRRNEGYETSLKKEKPF